MLDKTFVSDLFAEANAGLNAKRVVLCNQDTLNTPYKEGITGTAKEGTAYINMTSANYGEIVYFPSGGNNIFITHKAVTWRGWYQVALKSDLKTVTKTGITDDKGNVNTGLNSSYATVIYASPTSSTLDYKMSVHVNKRGEYWAKVLSSWLDNAPSIKNTQIEYMVRYLDYSGS